RLEEPVLPAAPGPLHGEGRRRLEHRPGQEPGEDPGQRPLQGLGLGTGPEPDPGPQRPVLRTSALGSVGFRVPPPALRPRPLDSVVFRVLPESTTQPAALQNYEVDLIYPSPSSTSWPR